MIPCVGFRQRRQFALGLIMIAFSFSSLGTQAAEPVQVRCALLDFNYQQTDRSFVLSIGGMGAQSVVLESRTELLPQGLRSQDGSASVCKRPGMKDSTDYENSYQTCGVRAQFSSFDDLQIISDFNGHFTSLPKTWKMSQDFLTDKDLIDSRKEDGRVGFIYVYERGRLSKAFPIQCSPEVLNVFIPGASQ